MFVSHEKHIKIQTYIKDELKCLLKVDASQK